ncbi:hypothetical protein J6590_097120 [Homalodisca vitripennis]|nr:hypothetical protein J6590_097120 [Homalodisca vitripennis]
MAPRGRYGRYGIFQKLKTLNLMSMRPLRRHGRQRRSAPSECPIESPELRTVGHFGTVGSEFPAVYAICSLLCSWSVEILNATTMDVGTLSVLVEKYEELYNMRHPEYFNNVKGEKYSKNLRSSSTRSGKSVKFTTNQYLSVHVMNPKPSFSYFNILLFIYKKPHSLPQFPPQHLSFNRSSPKPTSVLVEGGWRIVRAPPLKNVATAVPT